MIDFRLHTLGWQAFQDLCLHILRKHLGQTVQIFPPGNDGGRDGAFRGTWAPAGSETFSGTFTVQCKHTSRPSYALRASELKDELKKARSLAKQSLADNYILLTNATMTASQEAKAKHYFAEVGVTNFVTYDKHWINHTISDNKRLRSLVPRVYGLGDLSEILDERAYLQAKTLFASLEEELRNFVPTAAFRKAVRAIEEAGFVALLGSPGTGKSAIAATLCLYAADAWSTRTIRLAAPEDFVTHWNPESSDQVFWIDDAFGVTQYDASLSHRWNQYIPALNAAIRRGSESFSPRATISMNEPKATSNTAASRYCLTAKSSCESRISPMKKKVEYCTITFGMETNQDPCAPHSNLTYPMPHDPRSFHRSSQGD